MARFNAAVEVFSGLSNRERDDNDSGVLSRMGRKTVAVAGIVSAAAVFGMSSANADETNIYVGGNMDPTSQLPVDAAIAQGRYDHNDNNIRTNYSASIAPLGPVRMDQSIAEGSQKVYDSWNANRNDEKVRMECFSLGAAVCDVVASRIAQESGGALPGNLEIIRNGDGYGTVGIVNHPAAKLFEPIAKPIMEGMIGIPMNIPQTAGTTHRFDAKDLWGAGGSQGLNIFGLMDMALKIPQNHRIPDPREPKVTFVDKFGVKNEIYGGNPAEIARIVEAAGYAVVPGSSLLNFVPGAAGVVPAEVSATFAPVQVPQVPTLEAPVVSQVTPEVLAAAGGVASPIPGSAPIFPNRQTRVHVADQPDSAPAQNNTPKSTYGSHSSRSEASVTRNGGQHGNRITFGSKKNSSDDN